MIDSIFMLDSAGTPVATFFSGKRNQNLIQAAAFQISKDLQPVFDVFGTYVVSKKIDSFYLFATSPDESYIPFLSSLIEEFSFQIQKDFPAGLNVESISNNYYKVSLLLEELLNSGIPFSIPFQNYFKFEKVNQNVFPTILVPSIHEIIDAHVNLSGYVDFSLLRGSIFLEAQVSGNSPSLCSMTLENSDFLTAHYDTCIDPRCYNSDTLLFKLFHYQTIPFSVNSEEELKTSVQSKMLTRRSLLMRYTSKPKEFIIPISITGSFRSGKDTLIFELYATAPSELENVILSFVLPKCDDSPSTAADSGKVSYYNHSRKIVWTIGTLREKRAKLIGSCSALETPCGNNFLISASFKKSGENVTQTNIKTLKVDDENIPLSVTFLLQSGSFIVEVPLIKAN